MAASFPTSIKSFSAKTDGVDDVLAADVNDLQDEVAAVETQLLTTGAWTPALSFGGGTTGITYTTQAGAYLRVGNWVFISGYIVLSNKGSSTGAALVTGLPFTCYNNARAYSALATRMNGITFANAPQALVNINTTTVRLEEITEAGVMSQLADTDFTNTSTITVSGLYEITP